MGAIVPYAGGPPEDRPYQFTDEQLRMANSYVVPTVERRNSARSKSGEFVCMGGSRLVPSEDFAMRSGIYTRASHYQQFFARIAHRNEHVMKRLERVTAQVANAVHTQYEARLGNILTSASIEQATLDQVYFGRSCVDTIFSDLFRLLFSGVGRHKEDDRSAVSRVVGDLTENNVFLQLRRSCLGDASKAALGALMLLDLEGLADSLAQYAREAADESAESEHGAAPQSEDEQKSQGKSKEAAEKQNRSQLERDMKEVRDAVKEENGADELTGMANKMAGDTFSRGVNSIENVNQVLAITRNAMDPEFRKNIGQVVRALGRVEGVFSEALSDTSLFGDGEIMDVRVGGEMQDALPAELVYMCDDDLDVITDIRLQENQLLTIQRRGVDESGNGPLVCLVDTSYSTTDQVTLKTGSGFESYKAVHVINAIALAVSKYALEWGRPFAIIPFNGGPLVNEMTARRAGYPGSAADYQEQLTRTLGIGPRGGTSFTMAIAAAKSFIEETSGFEHSDILCITDGWGDAPETKPEAKEFRKNHMPSGVRLFGLFIEDDVSEHGNLSESNRWLFDSFIVTTGRNLSDGIRALFKEMVNRAFLHVDLGEDSV